MKISVDGVQLFELNDTQKLVIQNNVPSEIFEEDMKRRLQWVLMHKYEECFKELKSEWDEKLATNGVKMIPTNKDEYAKLVFSQSNYKDRSARKAVAEKPRS